MSVHGGNVRELAETLSCREDEIIDFSANINPKGFPSWLREEVSRSISSLVQYPDRKQEHFIKAVSKYHSVSGEMILGANGAGELIDLIPRVIKPGLVLIPVPSYGEYERSCRAFKTEQLVLKEENNFLLDSDLLSRKLLNSPGKKLVFIGQPNNPTGTLTNPGIIVSLAEKHGDTFFCIDESFADFIPGYISPAESITKNIPENIIIIRSMTKFYAVPGLRLGYCIASPEFIVKIKDLQPPWPVNTLALNVGERALQDEGYHTETVTMTEKLRTGLIDGLVRFPWLKVFQSRVNFLLVKTLTDTPAVKELLSFLLKKRIAVRDCSSFKGLDDSFFRIAVRKKKENRALLDALKAFARDAGLAVLEDSSSQRRTVRRTGTSKTPALMIQGTSSNAGKSLITAGLCRILRQEGVRVAPFKAQNMALNSAVTPNGREIGRAQALQARAAGIAPDVRMNPLLLKPTNERGSEVILSGLPAGFITSENWKEVKTRAKKVVEESYDSLSSDYDAIILEGAGSPAEINLKEGDIVNMKMARYAEAPVLIVGDIDRGGVYASFIGTMEVFEEWERNLVKGFIVNKFRGDAELLESAHEYIKKRTGIPVVGVVPYMEKIQLPEEDSVSFKEPVYSASPDKLDHELTIGVFDLPFISNFTDLDPLAQEAEVFVKILKDPGDITDDLDALIIPGSKNVIRDLDFLVSRGFVSALTEVMLKTGISVIGICGGFQMLGKKIIDPDHIESGKETARGMGLLDIETVFYKTKQLREIETVHYPSGLSVRGYEIHHGISKITGAKLILGSKEHLLGASTSDGSIWGTYLHGIFDNDRFRRWFLNTLREKKGLKKKDAVTHLYDPDSELDKLAEILKTHLDMDYLKKIMNL
ncbi:MAG: cobyric acid synthase [Spirochaetes bacterium]|nr:cobyric acid synthase [Spirochaetota bacterium]